MEFLELREVEVCTYIKDPQRMAFGFTVKSYSAFWGDEKVLSLERSVGYTSVYTSV